MEWCRVLPEKVAEAAETARAAAEAAHDRTRRTPAARDSPELHRRLMRGNSHGEEGAPTGHLRRRPTCLWRACGPPSVQVRK